MIRSRSPPTCWPWRVPWWRRPGSIRPTLPALASPTSARPPLPGTARRANRCATPWCGSVPAPASCVTSLRRAKAWQSWCVTQRVWCSRPTIRRARWLGSSRTFRRLPRPRRRVSCVWAPSMPGWSGRSRAARSFAVTGPMPAARSSSTCAVAAGASRCARPLASIRPAYRR